MSKAETQLTAEKAASEKHHVGPGRPRSFDEATALNAALQVFWRQGFEATSLDDLTAAMGLSRSSFYAAFGSKMGVFIAALKSYSENGLATLKDLSRGSREEAIEAMMTAFANPAGGSHGCMMVNCITELAPHDDEVAEIGRHHMERIEMLFASALDPNNPQAMRHKARALAALAIGTMTLRKSGVSPADINDALAAAKAIVNT